MKTKSKLKACFSSINNYSNFFHKIAKVSTLELKIYICGNPKGTSEGRLRQQGSSRVLLSV
jgi:hypothetical protein